MSDQSVSQSPELQLLIAGTTDVVRRLSAALRTTSDGAQPATRSEIPVSIITGTLAETKALAVAHRPDVLVVEVGFRTTARDIVWLRNTLSFLRERFSRNLHIVIAVTSSEVFTHAGELLFAEEPLAPSRLIDNLIIAAPPGVPDAPSLEKQIRDCISYLLELRRSDQMPQSSLPSLGDESWAPSICDPESRNVWMRWLPRYARYVNENPLIVGPTGSGKTRLAAALHHLSGRKGPFVSITPRDFSSNELVQAELFGAVPGAYTGAVEKWGLVKRAERGTLFIDELQSIDRDLQGKLITFIENKTFRRVGEAESHQADVRFVFATNRPLQELVDSGALRDDFAYRLERLQITLKPLSERRLDISAGICSALVKVLRERSGAHDSSSDRSGNSPHTTVPLVEGFTPDAYRLLYSARWPGNLRQLENTVAKLVEIAHIRRERYIDAECVREGLSGLLGYRAPAAIDVYREALRRLDDRFAEGPAPTLLECSSKVVEVIRTTALEVAGGDPRRAAELVGDAPHAMELLAATIHGKA